jgi:hypothetical protein
LARFRAPVAACLAILALLSQMLAPPAHRMARPDVADIASELKAAFGNIAVLCVQAEDGGNAPAPARDCDDSCPLCQFHSLAHTLIPPTLAGLPTRIDVGGQTPGLAPTVSLKNAHTAFAQPRGPPLAA